MVGVSLPLYTACCTFEAVLPLPLMAWSKRAGVESKASRQPTAAWRSSTSPRSKKVISKGVTPALTNSSLWSERHQAEVGSH